MADLPTKPVKGGKPAPVVIAPGVPPTDCFGECCGEHFSLRMATPLVKAGRKLERGAMVLALEKMEKQEQAAGRALVVNAIQGIIAAVKSGVFTGNLG